MGGPGNIRNYFFNKIDAKLSNSEFYDFYLASDEFSVKILDGIISGDSLIAEFDFSNPNIAPSGITSTSTIYSLSTWSKAVNTGLTLNNIGLTGLDNGLIKYEKDPVDIANTGLTSILTGITMEILSGETSLILHPVSGYTGQFIYPINILSSSTLGHYAQLCGGFYQGFYKIDDNSYQTLPNRFAKGWTVEFWLNKNNNCSGYTGTVLNDVYTGNTGFFFYLGTRAENKFWSVFEGLNSGSTSACTSGCTYWCTIPKEYEIRTTSGYPLDPPPLTIFDITNKFLIYSRAQNSNNNCNCGCGNSGLRQSDPYIQRKGYTICNFTGDSITLTATTMELVDKRNKFTIFSRATAGKNCTCNGNYHSGGTTTCKYSGDSRPLMELDWKADLENNAFGLRIKEDGSIGYRALRFSCITATTSGITTVKSGITVEESYSAMGMVQNDRWTHVAVKWVADTRLNDCELLWKAPRNGKLMFYINGRLKYVVRNCKEIIPKRLNEYNEKQEGVPFNISIGGGTQGLLESMTFDGQDMKDLGLLLETYFAGTFIGGINKFRFYDEPLSWCEIKNNFEFESEYFGI